MSINNSNHSNGNVELAKMVETKRKIPNVVFKRIHSQKDDLNLCDLLTLFKIQTLLGFSFDSISYESYCYFGKWANYVTTRCTLAYSFET